MLGISVTAVACNTTGASTTSTAEPEPELATVPTSPDRVTNIADIAPACPEQAKPSVIFTPLRRLNRIEYENTVRDLLGVEVSAAGFVVDSRIGNFASNVDVAISELQADQYRLAADSAASLAIADLGTLVSCDPAEGEACAVSFIRDFGRRAFRRPLSAEDEANYLEVFRTGAQSGKFEAGIALLVRALLQSPYFLYLVEPAPLGSGQATALGPYELASRLSYALWGSLPDAPLFAAAAAEELSTPEQLRAQAERLLADPRAKATLARFQLEWLQMDGIDRVEKEPRYFPGFSPELKQAMKTEVADFLDSVMQQPSGSFTDLLTAPYALVSGPLLSVYRAPTAPDATGPTRLDFSAGERSGILTQPAFLSTHAHQDQGSPVKRGVVVRQAILCQDLPPPPANVNNSPPPVTPEATTRQRFAAHSSDPACSGCHSLIDGIGFGFERYDAIGGYRDNEFGLPVDQTGNLTSASPNVEGPFDGPVELGQKLAASDVAQGCFVTQWFRFAYKRQPLLGDACTAKAMLDTFSSSQLNLRELVLAAVATDAFRYGMAEPVAEPTP